jgi:tetratricopeptide (TPR) repeat protein
VAYVVLPEKVAGSRLASQCLPLRALALSSVSWGQASHSEQVQVMPPLLRTVDPPAADATAADLEARADQLRAEKLYLDALDYYRAGSASNLTRRSLLNKIGITNLMMQRYREAKKSFERSIKANRNLPMPTTIAAWCTTKSGDTARR